MLKSPIQQQQEELNKQNLAQVKAEIQMDEYARHAQERQEKAAAFYQTAALNAAVHWKALNEYLQKTLPCTGQESYKEFQTCLMNYMGALMHLQKALIASHAPERLGNWLTSREFFGVSVDKLIEGGLQLLYKSGIVMVNPDGTHARYDINIDKDGKLNTEVIINGLSLPEDKKVAFDKGLASWLDQKGWTLNEDTNIITNNNDNRLMTLDDFDNLNQGSSSLAAYFNGTYDFQITPVVQRQLDEDHRLPTPAPR